MRDNKKPEKAENIKILPNFTAKIIRGTGHFPMIENPERFDELMQEAINELTK
ncbi:MAG: alpha/beta hydrolase [Ignavibacteriales bacterium]|nr:alpha/beta hydrolase [Ignavibacteriales bacterium]